MTNLNVTTNEDIVADDGKLSFREAAALASSELGAYTILFDASLAGQNIEIVNGWVGLTGNITIDGDVDGDGTSDIAIVRDWQKEGTVQSRLLAIHGEGSNVKLANLTLQGGNEGVYWDLAMSREGGAIHHSAGDLTVVNTTIKNSFAANGSAIASVGADSLTLVNTVFHDNDAHGGNVLYLVDTTDVAIHNVTMAGNWIGYSTFEQSALIHAHAYSRDVNLEISSSTLIHGVSLSYPQPTRAINLFASGNESGASTLSANIDNSIVAWGGSTSRWYHDMSRNTYTLQGDRIGYHTVDGIIDLSVNHSYVAQSNSFSGVGNVYDELGDSPLADRPTLGTLDIANGKAGALFLPAGNPLIGAGDADLLPRDIADVDQDGDFRERLPIDGSGNNRIFAGLDIGAHELPFLSPEPQDDVIVVSISEGLTEHSIFGDNGHGPDTFGAAPLRVTSAGLFMNPVEGGWMHFQENLFLSEDGLLTYTPNLNTFPREGSSRLLEFTYTLNGNATATVSITIRRDEATETLGTDQADVLTGTSDTDFMYGYEGDDTYLIDSWYDRIVEEADGGTDTAYIMTDSVDQTGSYFGWYGAVETVVLLGTTGISVQGDINPNRFIGNDGNNQFNGRGGADLFAGGKGDDTYIVDSADDAVSERIDEGTDTVISSVSWGLGANIENLELTGYLVPGAQYVEAEYGFGNELSNVITGNDRINYLDGLGGADTLIGGDGGDTYRVDNSHDVVVEKPNHTGTDIVIASSDFALDENVETLMLEGDAEVAWGNRQNNTIIGSETANVLIGYGGIDYLIGNEGDDIFVVLRGGSGDLDVVADFKGTAKGGGDRLAFSEAEFGLGATVTRLSQTSFEVASYDGIIKQQFILADFTDMDELRAEDYFFA